MIESAEEFIALRDSEDPALYHRAAHESAPLEVWYDVIARFPDFREWVVHNKTVPLEVLRLLADDEDDRVRYCVATKRKLTVDLLEKLAHDPDEAVRGRIAFHHKTPRALLVVLAGDRSWIVRKTAADRLADQRSS